MKQELLFIGAGGFGRVVLEHASGLYDCGFLDDGDSAVVDCVPMIGKTSDMASLYPEYNLLLVAIGNNKLRQRLYKEAMAIGYSFPIIHPTAYISPHAQIGSGCIILDNAVVQNNVKCGDGCILNPGVELHHDSTIGNYCLIYERSLTYIGDRVRIGSNATVSTSAKVPDDAVINDGAVYKTEE